MSTFAIIETGGKQYKVRPGDKIKVEKLAAENGSDFSFDKVLLVADGDSVKIGAPYIDGAKISAKVLGDKKGEKKIVFRYHSKTRYRKKKGHRQTHTELEVSKI